MQHNILPSDFIYPNYNDDNIVHVPSTVASLMNAPLMDAQTLNTKLWEPLSAGVKRVIIMIVDGLGWNIFSDLGLHFENAIVGKISSVFPSTTVNAMSSLWTGALPTQHGLVGTNMLISEIGLFANIVKFSPTNFNENNVLEQFGVKAESFLPVLSIANHFKNRGISVYALRSQLSADSLLSKVFSQGMANDITFTSSVDAIIKLRQLLESKSNERMCVYLYFSILDTHGHKYGPHGEQTQYEAKYLFDKLETLLLQKVNPEAYKDTALFVTSGHGQTTVSPSAHIHLKEHPALKNMLRLEIGGDPRVAYLYAKQGQIRNAQNYINENFRDLAFAIPSDEAIQMGLFGGKAFARNMDTRVGDVTVIMQKDSLFIFSSDIPEVLSYKGFHGGLTRDEMEVPWLGFRLG